MTLNVRAELCQVCKTSILLEGLIRLGLPNDFTSLSASRHCIFLVCTPLWSLYMLHQLLRTTLLLSTLGHHTSTYTNNADIQDADVDRHSRQDAAVEYVSHDRKPNHQFRTVGHYCCKPWRRLHWKQCIVSLVLQSYSMTDNIIASAFANKSTNSEILLVVQPLPRAKARALQKVASQHLPRKQSPKATSAKLPKRFRTRTMKMMTNLRLLQSASAIQQSMLKLRSRVMESSRRRKISRLCSISRPRMRLI